MADLDRRELRARGTSVPLGSRAFDVIEVLIRAAGKLVTKDELIGGVWPGAVVEDNTLQVHVSAIRRALGPERGLLKTASGRGYRLLGDWAAVADGAPEEAKWAAPPAETAQPFQTNLPPNAANLIGRSAAVRQVCDLLSAYRAVTLTGPGGIGKTKLAVEVARSMFPGLRGDAWLVELAALSDPVLVPSAVAAVLGVELDGIDASTASIARAIGDRPVLLVIDNCEHVIDAAARLIDTLLTLCSRTTILATSRELLRIDGERAYAVQALDVPAENLAESAMLLDHSAVQLFIARTQALHSGFLPRDDDLPVVAAICRRLDGIPLAIEFAAARVATLGLEQVLRRLDDRLGLLTSGRRTALPRHQTLRATLDWSYELLPEGERRLLRFLAIFAGGFTLEAAMAVASDGVNRQSGVIDGVANLVGKSLLALEGLGPANRWRLLETTRAYALEKLAGQGERETAARSHAVYFRGLLTSPLSGSSPAAEHMARCCEEIDNIRVALDWAFASGGEAALGVELIAEYVPAWIAMSLLMECRERVEFALDRLEQEPAALARVPTRLRISLGVAVLYTTWASTRTGLVLARALEGADREGDVESRLRALWALWTYRFNNGEIRLASPLAERFIDLARRAGDTADVLVGDRIMGNMMHVEGNQQGARACLERVLNFYVAPDDQRHANWFVYDQRLMARVMLARVLGLQGFSDQARHNALGCLADARAADSKGSICYALANAACFTALLSGDLAGTERAAATLIDLVTRYGAGFWRNWGPCLQAVVLVKRGSERGADALRAALDTFNRPDFIVARNPEFLCSLAEGLAAAGQLAAAHAAIEDALARSDRCGARWCLAEFTRVKGELLLHETGPQGPAAAEACFVAAVKIARQQGALAWELRAALSLARLRVRQARHQEAGDSLAPAYARFSEGFETADLRAAKNLLAGLPPPRAESER